MDEPDGEARFPIVGVGGSAGGLEVFQKLFERLPADTGAAFIVIQHLKPDQPSQLAEILGRHTAMTVQEIEHGTPAAPNTVFVAPPGDEVEVVDGELRLIKTEEGRQRPSSIDHFFRALANERGSRAIGVVLSGMGEDGTLGAKAIKSAGGVVLVQSPETAACDSMPRSAAATHVADRVIDIEGLSATLEQHIHSGGEQAEDDERFDFDHLKPILELVRRRTGHDFRGYKPAMLSRRVVRRMHLAGQTRLDDYRAFLDNQPQELGRLHRDLLVSVTDFFRDPEAYDALKASVFDLDDERDYAESPYRAWIPACATGEEAYSMAMLIDDALRNKSPDAGLQVFASDIDDKALAIARLARYPTTITDDLPDAYLKRYMRQTDHHYEICSDLRSNVVFAEQDILRDPPYSRLDLISCRNLLIYLSAELQNYLLALFHFALRDGGLLFLGSAESIGQATNLFEPVDQRHRLYRRIAGAVRNHHHFPFAQRSPAAHEQTQGERAVTSPGRGTSADQVAQQLLLREYVPACVLINRRSEVLCSYGPTHDYLALPTGTSRFDLMDMAAEDLEHKLRAVVREAIRENARAQASAVRAEGEHLSRSVVISARPLARPAAAQGLVLVTFEPTELRERPSETEANEPGVTEQLRATQEELQATIQSMEATNEDLQGSNEEITSMNEELQSTNEELETSKEELQSLNEELSTVNNELRDKIGQLERLNNDLANLFSGSRVATLFLDRELAIMRYTPAMGDIINLRSSDVGRPLAELKFNFDDPELLADAARAVSELDFCEREMRSHGGRWYLRRSQPYRTLDNNIDGAVVTFTDITELRSAVDQARRNEKQFRVLTDAMPALIAYIDHELTFQFLNYTFIEWFGEPANNLNGAALVELVGEKHLAAIQGYCDAALAGERVTYHDHYTHRGLGLRTLQVTHVPDANAAGNIHGFYLLATDITDVERFGEAARANRLASMNELAATMAHQLNQPLTAVSAYTSSLKRLVGSAGDDGENDARAIADKIEAQIHSASGIVHDFRDFIGRSTLERESLDINQVIRRVLALLERRIARTEAQIQTALDPQMPEIQASAVQLEQLFTNIVGNALEAVAEAGTRQISIVSEHRDGAVFVTVRDSGAGIDPDLVDRVFDTFYSSKADGMGMGMGLAIARGVAEEHGGRVSARTDAGHGAILEIELPA